MTERSREEKLEEKVEQLEKRLERLEQEKNSGKKAKSREKEKMSRRGFLKKAGLGAAGLGAAALLPSASAFNIKDSGGLGVYTDDELNFNVGPNGGIEIPNGSIIKNNASLNLSNLSSNTTLALDSGNFRIDDQDNNTIASFNQSGAFQVNDGELTANNSSGRAATFENEDDTSGEKSITRWVAADNAAGLNLNIDDGSKVNPDWEFESFDGEDIAFKPGGSRSLTLDSGGNIGVTRGNIDVETGGNARYLRFYDSGNQKMIYGYQPDQNRMVVADQENLDDLMQWNIGGPVSVKNSDLTLDSNQALRLNGSTSESERIEYDSNGNIDLYTSGGGSGTFRVRDSNDSDTPLLQVNEGGPVTVKNTDLEVEYPHKVNADNVEIGPYLGINVDPQNGDDSNNGIDSDVRTLDRALEIANDSAANMAVIFCRNSTDSNRIMLNNNRKVHNMTVVVTDGTGRETHYFEMQSHITLKDSNFYMYWSGDGTHTTENWHCYSDRMFDCEGQCVVGGGGYYHTNVYPHVDNWSLVTTHYDDMPVQVIFSIGLRFAIYAGSNNPEGSVSGARLHRGSNNRAYFIWQYDSYNGLDGSNVDTTSGVDKVVNSG